jgi:hypothetical protein
VQIVPIAVMIQISARIGEISNLSDSLSLPVPLGSREGSGLFQRGFAADLLRPQAASRYVIPVEEF